MPKPTAWMNRLQVPLYFAALTVGAITGLTFPSSTTYLEPAITPVLGLLLYATFLEVPLTSIAQAWRDWRFLATLLVLNFAVVPLVVFGLSRIVAHDQAVLLGVLLVLLTPCVDYVIVFTGLAGGAKVRLLAATPVLMVGQMLLLPAYLILFTGVEFAAAVDMAPFVRAFLLLIVLPLVAAGVTQMLSTLTMRLSPLAGLASFVMVPLMMLTLALVVASQIAGVAGRVGSLVLAVLTYVLFAVVMVLLGAVAGRVAKLDVPSRRAVVFSGVTRNSLVVLPLALALPDELSRVPLVVVTQTLIELVIMVILVRLIPAAVHS